MSPGWQNTVLLWAFLPYFLEIIYTYAHEQGTKHNIFLENELIFVSYVYILDPVSTSRKIFTF